jgi:hypothetical protein
VPYNAGPRLTVLNLEAYRGKGVTHETCNQGFAPDDRTSGHIRNGRRSSGSRLGRRLDTRVPTLNAEQVQINH